MAAPQAHAQDAPHLLFSLTHAEVEALASSAGWTAGERTETDEGDFSQTFFLSNGLPLQFEGAACRTDDLEGCPEYQLSVTFGVGSAERARTTGEAMSYRWANTWLPTEETIVVSRMDFLYGGVSTDHLRETFAVFEQIALDAAGKAFPCGFPVDGVEPSC